MTTTLNVCSICKTQTPTIRGFSIHMSRVHNMPHFIRHWDTRCHLCGEWFTARGLQVHLSKHAPTMTGEKHLSRVSADRVQDEDEQP